MAGRESFDSERVGFIGLGNIGGAIASRIIGAGFPTVLWARRPDALAPFLDARVESAESPADLAAWADIVGICVWSDEDVREVMLGDRGVLAGCRPGTVVAIHSTTQPGTCRDLAEAARELDVVVIDAPVSGGRDGALGAHWSSRSLATKRLLIVAGQSSPPSATKLCMWDPLGVPSSPNS